MVWIWFGVWEYGIMVKTRFGVWEYGIVVDGLPEARSSEQVAICSTAGPSGASNVMDV